MAGRVAVVVLLVVVFVGALGLASAGGCVKPDRVVKEGKEEIIYQKNETEPQEAVSTKLYVKPGDGVMYSCIKVEGKTLGEAEICPDFKTCRLNRTTWNLLKVEAKVVNSKPGKYQVEFILTVDDCEETEIEGYKSENIARLSVTAHGASEWLLSASEYQSNGPPDSCPDTTTENPSSMIIVAAVIAVAAVVAVCIWQRRRILSAIQRVLRCIQSTSRRDTDIGYSGQVVENSLFDPLPGPVTPAARQEQPGTVQAIENTLYEPLPGPVTPAARQEQPGTVQVIENTLYEPLPGPVTPAARQEQPGTVQVIENTLYEPLPGP